MRLSSRLAMSRIKFTMGLVLGHKNWEHYVYVAFHTAKALTGYLSLPFLYMLHGLRGHLYMYEGTNLDIVGAVQQSKYQVCTGAHAVKRFHLRVKQTSNRPNTFRDLIYLLS